MRRAHSTCFWTAVDQQALRKGKVAAKQLIRDGGGRNIDLSGLSFEPDGIAFPFQKALTFRNAYTGNSSGYSTRPA